MKKYNSIIAAFIVFTVLFSCTQPKKGAHISVDIKNMGNDTVMIALWPYSQNSPNQFDTLVVHNGKFSIDTVINEPQVGIILSKKMYTKLSNGTPMLIRSKKIDFFISPDEKIKIAGTMSDSATDYQVEGGLLNEQNQEFQKLVPELKKEESWKIIEVNNLYVSGAPDSVLENVWGNYSEIKNDITRIRLNFIKMHPDYKIAAYYLKSEPKDVAMKYFPLLDQSVAESGFGKIMQEKIDVWKATSPGETAPVFSHITFKNNTFDLKDYRGKYVVLDFWGSWCGPCMNGIPNMKKYQKEYKDKIQFVSIACRDDSSRWAKTITDNNLDWIQVFNDGKGKNDLSKIYGIEGYPTKIIIDPDGKIVESFLGETEDFYKKLDELFAKKG